MVYKVEKAISTLLVLLTTIYVIAFYVCHSEILNLPRYKILVKYGLFGVLVPVVLYFIAGFLFYMADAKSNDDSDDNNKKGCCICK